MRKPLFLLCCIIATITLTSCSQPEVPANIVNDSEAVLYTIDLEGTNENVIKIVKDSDSAHYIFNTASDEKVLEVYSNSDSSANNAQEVSSDLIVISDDYTKNIYKLNVNSDTNKEYIFVDSNGKTVVKLLN